MGIKTITYCRNTLQNDSILEQSTETLDETKLINQQFSNFGSYSAYKYGYNSSNTKKYKCYVNLRSIEFGRYTYQRLNV